MGTRCKGFTRVIEVDRIRHVDGKPEKYSEKIEVRGRRPGKKRKPVMGLYSNPSRIPRSKRSTNEKSV
jgi:hypothetical protein